MNILSLNIFKNSPPPVYVHVCARIGTCVREERTALLMCFRKEFKIVWI